MTLDDDLVRAVDRIVRRLGTSRSGEALWKAVRRVEAEEMERRQKKGYQSSCPARRVSKLGRRTGVDRLMLGDERRCCRLARPDKKRGGLVKYPSREMRLC